MLLEFKSVKSKINFKKICASKPELLAKFNHKAHIRLHTYTVIMRFVPCSGQFDPSNAAHLREAEAKNDIPPDSIVSAVWCKRPDKRSPNQKTVMLKVLCASPEAANLLLTGQIRIDDHLVTIHKDIKLPIHCLKCQEYGHMRDTCIGVEKCANCASVSHSSLSCAHEGAPSCVSCGARSKHTSSSPSCPIFVKKCAALDNHTPENTMLYFPTNEAWTWASSPSNPPRPASPPIEAPPMRASSHLHLPRQE